MGSNFWNINDNCRIVIGTSKLKLGLPIIGTNFDVNGSALPIIKPFQEIGKYLLIFGRSEAPKIYRNLLVIGSQFLEHE